MGAALVLITINLRLAIGSVPPVLDDIEAAFGLSKTTAGLITTVPVLCFGLAAPLAPRLARRFGQELLLLGALAVICAGLLIRLLPSVGSLFVGTVVIGVAIAVANVLMPSVVKRRFERPGLMMGLFTMSLSVGAALAAAFTVPMEDAFGSWRWALAAWAVPALVAIVAWAPEVRRSGAEPSDGADGVVRLWNDPTAWLVTGLFALQSLLFYCLLAWVPDILRDAGLSSAHAGAMLSLAMLCGIPAALGLPVLMQRLESQSLLIFIPVIPWALGLAGLMVSPGGATWLWMVLAGSGQGAGIALALTLVVLRSPDAVHAASLSGMAQGAGYAIAAAGPLALGAVHDATGGWHTPLALLLLAVAGMLVLGLGAGRPRFVRADIPPVGGSSAPVL